MRRVVIRGKRWILRYVPNLGKLFGYCDHPTKPNKTITIQKGLKGRKKLEILLHEILHAAQWDLDEESVTEIAHDAARIIWDEMGGELKKGDL